MEERLRHSLDLLVVVMVNLTTVVEHVTDVGDSETELVNGLGSLLVGTVPEAAHGVLKVLLNRVGIRHAVGDVSHAVEVEGTDEETLDKASNLSVVMSVVSLSNNSDQGGSESTIHLVFCIQSLDRINIIITLDPIYLSE